jgi:hypothetical protein
LPQDDAPLGTGDGIAEAASENPTKKRRGRPTRFLEGIEALGIDRDEGYKFLGAGSNARTKRGRMEAEYAVRASRALFAHRHEHPELLELTGCILGPDGHEHPAFLRPPEFSPKAHRPPVTALAELGRLICDDRDGEAHAVNWALEWLHAKPRPPIKQAVSVLRRRRVGMTRPGEAGELARAIARAINRYVDAHPDTTSEMVGEALEYVYSCTRTGGD